MPTVVIFFENFGLSSFKLYVSVKLHSTELSSDCRLGQGNSHFIQAFAQCQYLGNNLVNPSGMLDDVFSERTPSIPHVQ